jgi:uncharacterized membrane protein YidH (DUF202 family)
VTESSDQGLAAERTTLAWRRSGVSVIAIGIAVARGIPTVETVPARPFAGVAIVVLGVVAFAVSHVQAVRRSAHVGTDRPAAALADLLPVTAATVMAAVGAAVVVLLS